MFSKKCLDSLSIKPPIRLSTRATNSWSFAPVQDAKLNASPIDSLCHQAIKGINLSDQMASPKPTNCRVTGHDPNRIDLMGQQQHLCAKPRGGGGGFNPGMAAADNDDINTLHLFVLSGIGYCVNIKTSFPR